MFQTKLQSRDFNILSKGHAPEVHSVEHHAELARMRGEKEIQIANSNIRCEYRKRIHDTRELRDRLMHHMENLKSEISAMEQCKASLLECMAEFQRPIQLTMQWMSLREKRPPSPTATGDHVDRALKQSSYDIKGGLGQLAVHLSEVEAVMKELIETRTRFERDIESKRSTILLDEACMNETIEASARQDGPLPRALLRSHGMSTENDWRNVTNVSISSGVAIIQKSKGIRSHVVECIRSLERGGLTKRPLAVVDALGTRLKQNIQLRTNLQVNCKMSQGELLTLDKHKAMLLGSLEKVKQQMNHALQRLELRVVKPTSEALRQGVEEQLEVEVIKLRTTEATLRNQLAELEKKRARLAHLIEQMTREISDKSEAIHLDQECDGLPLPPLTGRTPRGASQSPRNPARTPR